MRTVSDTVVIGGGLAGTSVAHALSIRGIKVALIEQHPALAVQASGNHLGLAIPYITAESNPAHEVYAKGFELLEKTVSRIADERSLESFRMLPTIQFPSADRPKRLLKDAATNSRTAPGLEQISREDASELAGIHLKGEMLLYPKSFVVSPPELCSAYTDSPLITKHLEQKAISISKEGSRWQVKTDREIFSTESLVIAGAYEAKEISHSSWLRLEPVRGQLFTFSSESSSLGELKIPLCFDGYMLPSWKGRIVLGATYTHGYYDLTPIESHNEDLRNRLHSWIDGEITISKDSIISRASFRTSTFDRLPYIGELPVFEEIQGMNLRWGKVPEDLPRHERCYVNLGHGSRGVISTALGAELIASQICGDQSPSKAAASTLDPMRYMQRLIKREELKSMQAPA